MADPAQTLTFLSWVRPATGSLVTGQEAGRARAEATVTLSAAGANGVATGRESRTVSFLVAGPADVAGLSPGAIVRRYPAPGTSDHESDRCPYIELADPTLPWRYTPAPNPAGGSAALRPWLVLVVGEEGAELALDGGRVTIEVAAQLGEQALGDPTSAYRFAHVQQDATGHRVARVLCGRPLRAGADYLAAVVPAFDETGAPSWTGAAAVTVPAYDVWRFRTAVPPGSFEDLAAKLTPGQAPDATGRAPLRYPRLAGAPELHVLGALVGSPPPGEDVAEEALPPSVADDLARLRLPAHDEAGRPIVTLPHYGDAWNPKEPADQDGGWVRGLNDDPRHRGVAGLGLEVGIRFQEELVADVLAHLGAVAEARQRVRHLAFGLAASRSLWRRRVPTDPAERLWLLGPSLGRLLTDAGTVADQATAAGRALPRGMFSAAARRVLRPGPARTALSTTTNAPTAVLAAANRQPAPPPETIDGLPWDEAGLSQLDVARQHTVEAGRVATAALFTAAAALADRADSRVRPAALPVVAALRLAASGGQPAPWGQALATLAAGDADVIAAARDPQAAATAVAGELTDLRDAFAERADDADLTELLAALGPAKPDDPAVTPVGIDALAGGVGAALTPMTSEAPALVRVLATIEGGIDPAQPLAPPEPCVGLDRPAWADVGRAFGEWLLPGIGRLPDNSVVGLETNPIFIDAFLAGLNTQLLSELRWRNIPVATGCTPIRRFWDRTDTAAGERADDVVGIGAWPKDSPLGDPSHRPPGATGQQLVIAVRGDLLLRYPTTLVYLRSALHGTATVPDFDQDPDDAAPRLLPGFHGRLGADVTFYGFPAVDVTALAHHWLVLEEPPAGYRFANDSQTPAATGHGWAAAALAHPVRVLLRGDKFTVGGA
jgi:hypothetical protein